MTERERQLVDNWRGDKNKRPHSLSSAATSEPLYEGYKDVDARKEYMREYMRRRRAKEKS